MYGDGCKVETRIKPPFSSSLIVLSLARIQRPVLQIKAIVKGDLIPGDECEYSTHAAPTDAAVSCRASAKVDAICELINCADPLTGYRGYQRTCRSRMKRDQLKHFEDFYLEAKARIWP